MPSKGPEEAHQAAGVLVVPGGSRSGYHALTPVGTERCYM